MARNVPTELILLEFIDGMKTIISNPDLSATIKNAYALSEDEKAAAIAAQDYIAKAATLKSDLEAQAAKYADVETRIAEAEKLEAYNADTLRDIEKQRADIAVQQNKNIAAAQANKDKEMAIINDRAILESDKILVESSKKEIDKTKSDLKKRTDAIKAQANF